MDALGVREIAVVFAAGGLGAAGRVTLQNAVDLAWSARLAYVGTLSANLIGCLAIGFCAVAVTHPLARAGVLGGLLGGFTTYSSFALLSTELASEGRWGTLGVQLGAHLLGGVLAVVVGIALARGLGFGAAGE